MFNDVLLPGSTLSVGGKDVEVDELITREDYMAGRPFLNGGTKKTSTLAACSSDSGTPKKAIRLPKGKLFGKTKKEDDGGEEISAESFYNRAPPKTSAIGNHFKNPVKSTTVMAQQPGKAMTPRHDPFVEGALVMRRPKDVPSGKKVVDVVVDPFLGKHLRDHQREGVQFLYECVMGLRDTGGNGALLADEMGLGKTLQTIALVWTLIKQSPFYTPGNENMVHKGAIRKVVIVCPVTLVDNWKKEFRKWLGAERLGVLVMEEKTRISDFTHRSSYSVLIIGYEKLRNVADFLKKGNGIDLVVADEGHRLKTAKNKAAEAIKSLNCNKRIILSGTPLQNDLSEFYVMVDFLNDGILGTPKSFKKVFEGPILRSRQPDAGRDDEEKGLARQEELSSLTSRFILRRTAEVMAKYLPPKTEYVVFCKPTHAQIQVYASVLDSPYYSRVLGQSGPEASFQLITLLKKICNAPSLLAGKDDSPITNPVVLQLLDSIPQEILRMAPVNASGKFRMLDALVRHLSQKTTEKIVIVSHYTATLDLIGQYLASMSLTYARLDGKTPVATRQGLVDRFNKTNASQNFAFLLSAKSGGTGLNLIGASRLVLFDVDWNPSIELQAMARIHRDGQQNPVKIYRFLMAGALDEKIYQRQVTKMGLADEIVDGKKTESSFSAAELRDLFRLETAKCQTHDLIACDCEGCGRAPPTHEALKALQDGAVKKGSSSDDSAQDDDSDDDVVLYKPRSRMVPAIIENVNAGQDEALQAKKAKKTGGEMQWLFRYRHVDTSILQGNTLDAFDQEMDEVKDVKDALDDQILVDALMEAKCKVNYVFAKKG